MVKFPPLAPDIDWWADFYHGLSEGGAIDRAILYANSGMKSSKEFGRFQLLGANEERLTLSLAVEGGSRQLRDVQKISNCTLSEHGNWRKNHLGAMDACLGRKPFFRELENRLSPVYMNPGLDTLESFNFAIFQVMFSFLMGTINIEEIHRFEGKPTLISRGEELADESTSDISLLQALATHGREILLALPVIKVRNMAGN